MKCRDMLAFILITCAIADSQTCTGPYPYLAVESINGEVQYDGAGVPKYSYKCSMSPSTDVDIQTYTSQQSIIRQLCVDNHFNQMKTCDGSNSVTAAILEAWRHMAREMRGLCIFSFSDDSPCPPGPWYDPNLGKVIFRIMPASRPEWERLSPQPYGAGVQGYYNCGNSNEYIPATIYINQGQKFRETMCIDLDCGVLPPDRCMSLRTVILHEFLHTLGIGHSVQKTGTSCLTESEYRNAYGQSWSNDIMHYNAGYNRPTSISCYIECAIKAKYCPDELNKNMKKCSGVNGLDGPIAGDLSVSVSPNPSRGLIVISDLDSPDPECVIQVYDNSGTLQTTLRRVAEKMRSPVAVQLRSRGVFYVVVTTKNAFRIVKVVNL